MKPTWISVCGWVGVLAVPLAVLCFLPAYFSRPARTWLFVDGLLWWAAIIGLSGWLVATPLSRFFRVAAQNPAFPGPLMGELLTLKCQGCGSSYALFYCPQHRTSLCIKCTQKHDTGLDCLYFPAWRALRVDKIVSRALGADPLKRA